MCTNCSSTQYSSRYVGLPIDKAKIIALKQGFSKVKVIYPGMFVVLEDKNERINFWIEDEKVIKAAVG